MVMILLKGGSRCSKFKFFCVKIFEIFSLFFFNIVFIPQLDVRFYVSMLSGMRAICAF